MKDRLKKLLEALNVKQTAFARELNLNEATIRGIFTGKSQSLSARVIIDIQQKYNVNPVWLVTGKGEMFLSDTVADSDGMNSQERKVIKAYRQKTDIQPAVNILLGIEMSKAKDAPEPDEIATEEIAEKIKETVEPYSTAKAATGKDVPLLGRIAAGVPMWAEENIEEILRIGRRFLPRGNRPLFAVTVSGFSMSGAGIMDGDIVVLQQVFSPREDVKQKDIVAALVNGEVTLKRIFFADNSVELRPENPAFESIFIGKKDMAQIQGKLVLVIRKIIEDEE